MASFHEIRPRNVIPNWRSYQRTSELGELKGCSKVEAQPLYVSIDDYISDWKKHPSVANAGDLLSAALISGNMDIIEAKDAAKYILEHEDKSSIVLIRTARTFLAPNALPEVSSSDVTQKLSDIICQEDVIKQQVRILKKAKDYGCFNPIAYCELARCYVILGQNEKAKEAMDIAVHLAPAHRYVTRSAARLYLHLGERDKAHFIVSHNPLINADPWLMASEIAINTLDDRNSRFIKKGMELIQSKQYSPFSTSELASAIGSIELMNGKRKSCRDYMNSALVAPNDNALAQAQWLLSENKDLTFRFHDLDYQIAKSEADSMIAFLSDDFKGALQHGIEWIGDMPFTRRPIEFASNIAFSYLKDYDSAISILQFGLKSHAQDPSMLNNLAYVYGISGKPEDAMNVLNQAKVFAKDSTSSILHICLSATEGLAEFRLGHIEEGERLYLDAIKQAGELPNEERGPIVTKALLNYMREKAIARLPIEDELVNAVEMSSTFNEKELIQLKHDTLLAIHTSK